MNTKSPQINYIYDRYKKASPTKKAVVEMRITYAKKQKYISTGISLFPNQWKKGVVINCIDALQLNQILDKMLMNVRQIIFDMTCNEYIDIFSIPKKLRQINENKTSFLDFCNQRALIRKYGKTLDSQKRYDRFIRFFREWGRIVDFEDVTEANIISYDKYLTRKNLKPYSKWNNYHRFLNSFILDAIDEGFLHRNPYKWVNICKQQDDSIHRYLTPEEFQRIRNTAMPTKSLEKVRDIFIFQTYTCLSYADLRCFDSANLQEMKGIKVYIDSRKKTKKSFTIPILPPVLEILNKYKGKIPVMSNVKYNKYLKKVAQAAGIDKPISSHWARHTGATLLLNEGVDMQIVSKICGHSSTRITEQVYAKILDETVVDAVAKIKINT